MRTCLLVASLLGAGCGRGPLFKFQEEIRQRRCEAVDFLFVIDNSESMQRHQDNLVASFDPFIRGIRSSLDDVDDFHLGVVTSDAYRDNEPECRALGALVTSVDGPGRDSIECAPYAEGERYMTQEDDLAKTFACAANVGTDGNREEEPMGAMTLAIGDAQSHDLGHCNDGFIRPDALLMTVIITDEADGTLDPDHRADSPDAWFESVVAAKGSESNAVVLSLLNGATQDCPVGDPEFDGALMADFTERFTHGFVSGICQPDYGPVFDRAVEEVDIACDEWTERVDLP